MKSIRKTVEILSLVMAFVAMPMISRAQTATEIAEMVMHSDEYLYGEGYGQTVNSARQPALASRTSKVSVSIRSTSNITEKENNTDEGLTTETKAKSIGKDY